METATAEGLRESLEGAIGDGIIEWSRRHCPPLTVSQATYIADIFNSTAMDWEGWFDQPDHIIWQISDTEVEASKYDFDHAAFLEQVKCLPEKARLSLVVLAKLWWQHDIDNLSIPELCDRTFNIIEDS